jgi:hypothetical protein
MRHLLLFLFFSLIFTGLFAQETDATTDPAEDFTELKKRINKSSDRLAMDFTYDLALNMPDSIKTKGFSRGFNIYFMYDVVLGKSRFSIAPGFGLGTNNYFHNNTISSDTAGTYFNPIASDIKVKKNKLSLTYLDIPIEFRFRSKPNAKDNSWKFAVGFKAGLLIHNKWKYKGEEVRQGPAFEEGREVKFKEYNIENLNRFRYGVTARAGYGVWNVFAFYGISELFKEGRGPGMTPLSIGVSINGL